MGAIGVGRRIIVMDSDSWWAAARGDAAIATAARMSLVPILARSLLCSRLSAKPCQLRS
jgi:hypothetical protein